MEKINSVYVVENKIGGGMKKADLSQAEIKSLHGEVVTYDLGKPTTYEIFENWPEDVRREYLKKLYWSHGGSYKEIAEMLGTTFQHVAHLFNEYSLPRRNAHAHKSPELKKAWKAFLMGKTLVKDTLPVETAQKLVEMVKEEKPVLLPLEEEKTVTADKEGDATQALLFAITQLVHHNGAHVEIKITL